MNCLPSYRTTDTIRVSDHILLYRSGGNLVYRNDLKGGCPGLARDSDIMVVEQFGSRVCSGDFFYLVDRSSGIRGPTCVFGDFVPYRKRSEERRVGNERVRTRRSRWSPYHSKKKIDD